MAVFIVFVVNSFFIQYKYKCLSNILYVVILLIINAVGAYNNLRIWKFLNRIEKVFNGVGSILFFVLLILFTRLFINECMN